VAITLPLLTNQADIATDRFPLRASALPNLLECPASVLMSQKFWVPGEDEGGGKPAQTGNLVHSAAAVFHRTPGTPEDRTEAGLAALEAARSKFPLGEVARAKKHWLAYAADPKNQEAEVVKCEETLTARLPPSPLDPTKKPVVVRGHLDQLRREPDGRLTVYDIKTGARFYGQVALDHYMVQQAAYVYGAWQTWKDEFPGARFDAGALICTEGYFKPMGRPYWYHKWNLKGTLLILRPVVNAVAAARAGLLDFRPSTETCKWCDHKSFANCSAFYEDHVS
jgi:hypothetical protein